MKEALLYENRNGDVECRVCARTCTVSDGHRGVCRVRENRGGEMYALTYGKVSSRSADPIEKKPLYHFHPGTRVMSFGSAGCSFRCDFCQNHRIAWSDPEDLGMREESPVAGVDAAEAAGCGGVAYTYNEPIVWLEHALEGCREAKDRGMYTAFVTNGYFTPESLDLVAPHLDAANVDVKAFGEEGEEFYRSTVSGELEPVLRSCEELYRRGVHLELTYLVVPGRNDGEEALRGFASWVREELGPEVPVHFSRFRPMHRMRDAEATPVSTMERAHDVATGEGLEFVYLGNVPGHRYGDTYCPGCGATAIARSGFSVRRRNLDGGSCGECGRDLNLVTES